MGDAVTFACEISEDRSRAAIAAAWRDADHLVAEIVFYDHPAGAAARLTALRDKHDPVAIVIDGRSQAATLLGPLAEAGVDVTQPSTQDVTIAHGDFLDLVRDGVLRHLAQPELTAAVRGAQQRPLAGAQAWERRVQADQAPLVAATFAVWALRRWEELSEPGAWLI